MDTTLTIIENFSEKYPELTGWGFNFNAGGNVGLAVLLALGLLTVIIFAVTHWMARSRNGASMLFIVIVGGMVIATLMTVVAPTSAQHTVARWVNSNATDEQYSELLGTVANDDPTQRRVAEQIYRTTGLGSTPYDAHEMVCEHDDNDQSVLCGGEQSSTITYDDFDDNDRLTTTLSMWPVFEHDEDSDEMFVMVGVGYTATN